MTSKSESLAPPPCEIEEEICSCHVDSHFHAANHHAEIAELRALFGPLMDEADWHVEGCDCAGCVWFEKARSALASKGGT